MTWQPSSGCYRCGDLSHFVADCPVPRYPAEVTPAPGSARPAIPPPVPRYDPVPPEVAAEGARRIREQMGWPEPPARSREPAAAQVRQSRARVLL